MKDIFKLKTSEIKDFLEQKLINVSFDSIKRECLKSFQHEVEFIYLLKGEDIVGEYFLRAYKGTFSWWSIFGDLDKREEIAIKYLQDLSIRCPAVAARGVINNTSVMFTEKIDGVWLKDKVDEASVSSVAMELGNLHKKSLVNPIRSVHIPDISIDVFFETMLKWSVESGDQRVIDAVKLTRDKLNLKCRAVSFLHGDLNTGNVLIEDDSVLFIDFEESAVGSPMIDVATFCELLNRYKKEELKELFIIKYEESSGYKVEQLEEWIKVMKLRDLVTGAYIKSCLNKGLEIPIFNHESWIRYGDKALESYSV